MCKQVMFCHVQTCDETQFNGESRDCHKFVFGAFYWLLWQLELCNKGRNSKGSGE